MTHQPPPTPHMALEQIQAIIKTVDEHAREMNRRWGFNRLPHIVPIEWTERFCRQKAKWEMACFECVGSWKQHDIDRVRQHGEAMIRAFDKLEEIALEAGKSPAPPGQWEFELNDGTTIVLVRTRAEQGQVEREPAAQVWCLEEIGEIITRFPELVLMKNAFPEAEVIQMRTSEATRQAVDELADEIPF